LNWDYFWHTSCDVFGMARKIDALKLTQENWGLAEITNRRPTSDSAVLYLLDIRPTWLKVPPPRKRLSIFVKPGALVDLPQEVKIRHAG
jgi:hypothetical protein